MTQKRSRLIHTLTAFALTVALVAAFFPGQASAVTSAQKRAEAQAALAQLETLSEELNAVSDVYFGALHEAEAAQAQMDDAQARIDETQARIEELQTRISSRAVAMYKNGTSTVLDFLFGAETFEEFATCWDVLQKLNAYDMELTTEAEELEAQIQEEKKVYEEAKANAEAQAEAVREAYERAAALEQAQRDLYYNLSAEAQALYEEEQAAAEAQARAAAKSASVSADTSNPILARAFSKLDSGAHYVWATCGPDTFDCSGFVSWCYGYSSHVFTSANLIGLPGLDDPQPGDVAVKVGHAALYIGNGQIIECTNVCDGIRIYSSAGYKFVRPSSNW